ncbi:MAG: hypothetical protein ACTSVO_00465 [Candidatus Heimdallarchaeaceae archaeon]
MKKYFLTLHLHPSISSDNHILKGETSSEMTLLESIILLLNKNKNTSELLIIGGDIRPGYLLISEKIELRTTKKLFNKIDSNIEIKIVPISHGG